MISNYQIDKHGIIHQIQKKTFVYDRNYVDKAYGSITTLTDEISYLRLGYLIGAIGKIPSSILDVGYGRGDFLRSSKKIISKCYGYDLFNDFIPNNCVFVDSIFDQKYDVITFFDSLEHHENINFIHNIQCNYIVISVPWCHNINDIWFQEWKHRKPNEHLHHFNEVSLTSFMNENNYELITFSNVEDSIRKPIDHLPNILTAVYKKL